MANSNGWGDGAANNAIGWGQGANNNIGWGDSHAKSYAGLTDIVGLDSSASAFISAAGITDATQISAINNLVVGMKADGIWIKMKAIYPFVGGTASTHKWNLKDPRDLDAAFRLVFNGGWTHSSTGATPNGTNGYADTNVINNTNLTDRASHWSMYFRTLVNDGFNGYYQSAAGAVFGVQPKDSTTKIAVGLNNLTVTTVTSTLGYYVGSINSTTLGKLYVNNSNAYNTITPLNINANLKFYIGALNSSGTAILYSSNQCSFSTLGDKLTDTEAANLYSRVNTFQVALSRNV
jgi:hypothetical protein